MLSTTLIDIKKSRLPKPEWQILLKNLGKNQTDGKAVSYEEILRSGGINIAIWCFRTEPRFENLWRHFAVWCAEQVAYLAPDPRADEALSAARMFLTERTDARGLRAAWTAANEASIAVWKRSEGKDGGYQVEREATNAVRDVAANRAWEAADKVSKSAEKCLFWLSMMQKNENGQSVLARFKENREKEFLRIVSLDRP